VEITRCSALNGGGVFLANIDYVIMDQVNVTDNFAANIGGGVVLDNIRHISISRHSVFSGNRAVNYGGAIAINKVTSNVIIT
jgi:predicted outer membrane repeat protein